MRLFSMSTIVRIQMRPKPRAIWFDRKITATSASMASESVTARIASSFWLHTSVSWRSPETFTCSVSMCWLFKKPPNWPVELMPSVQPMQYAFCLKKRVVEKLLQCHLCNGTGKMQKTETLLLKVFIPRLYVRVAGKVGASATC